MQRHIRKLYPDPITGKEWGIVQRRRRRRAGRATAPSEATPLKIAGFRVRDASFEGAEKYADWKFIHAPTQAAPPATPTPKPPART